MKKFLAIGLCAGLGFALAGCATEDCHNECSRTPCPPSHSWRCAHRWSDGYSFSNDPYNHDLLGPYLGLDPQFPPAPAPSSAVLIIHH